MKKILVSLLLVCLLCSAVCAATFEKVNTYKVGQFSDVHEEAWYNKEVAGVYEKALMTGVTDTLFAPYDEVTVAQGITLAARLRASFYGEEIPKSDGQWYQMYVDYAMDKGFINQDTFDSFVRPITRFEACVLCAKALPKSVYSKKLNSVGFIPDVPWFLDGTNTLLDLYNAGIVMGTNEIGTFLPNEKIARCEFAAIVNRFTDEASRIQSKLKLSGAFQPYVLVEDNELPFHAWNRDTRGMTYPERLEKTNDNSLFGTLTDISDIFPVTISRDFKPAGGILTLNHTYKLSPDSDGFFIKLHDGYGNDLFVFEVKDGYYYSQGQKLEEAEFDRPITINALIDRDNKYVYLKIDTMTLRKILPLTYDGSVSRLTMGFTEKGKGSFTPCGVNLTANYFLNERFINKLSAYDWISNNGELAIQKLANSTYSLEDIYSAKFTSEENKKSSVWTQFCPLAGDAVFETKFLLPKASSGVSFVLGQVDNGFYVTTDGNNLLSKDGKVIGQYTPNVWTTLRYEIDLSKKTALVKINGKEKGSYSLAGTPEYFDEFCISVENSAPVDFYFDDVILYPKKPKPSDYVPVPVPAKEDEYYLGLNTCNLWRLGYWHGITSSWHVVSAFDELTPYLGYYDDGNPEVSDWEIKYMAEHGIDYQLQCWYGPSVGDTPVKTPGFSQNLHDGYFNAQYKDYSKFAVMWENNFTDTIDSQGFRNNFVPFWIDYYFKDPNYFTIDNKPLFTIYNYSRFVEYFKTTRQAKAELDYLRDEVKKLGFDDVIIMFANGSADEKTYKDMAQMGAVGAYNYNLGTSSSSEQYQKGIMESNAQKGAVSGGCSYIPTISVGFNNVARGDTRHDNISLEDYNEICKWTKNSLLTNSKYYDQSSLTSKMALLSCWNEYDEGHYIIPSSLYGFGFLDVLRKNFSKSKEQHEDIKPTQAQKDRLCALFPEGFSMLRPTRWYKYGENYIDELLKNKDSLQTIVFEDFTNSQTHLSWKIGNTKLVDTQNGLVMESTTSDTMMQKSFEFEIKPKQIIHVRFKGDSGNSAKVGRCEVFFTTAEFDGYAQRMSKTAMYDYGQYVDLYIDLSSNPYWRGKCTGLRFDFNNEMGVTTTLELAEVLQLPYEEEKVELEIDGGVCELELPIEQRDGVFYVPFVPDSGIFGMLNSSYKWSRIDNKLEMTVAFDTITFEMGKSAKVNNVEIPAPYLFDGIPMLAIKQLCDAVGYTCDVSGEKISIDTGVYGEEARETNNYYSSKPEYSYLFEVDGGYEGFEPLGVSQSSVKDGCLYGNSNSNDPRLELSKPNIDANMYKKCVVRMKVDIDCSASISVYFSDQVNPLSEARSVKMAVQSKEKDFVEYTIDMSKNPYWRDSITKLRFDPMDCRGEFWIDSIEFLE